MSPASSCVSSEDDSRRIRAGGTPSLTSASRMTMLLGSDEFLADPPPELTIQSGATNLYTRHASSTRAVSTRFIAGTWSIHPDTRCSPAPRSTTAAGRREMSDGSNRRKPVVQRRLTAAGTTYVAANAYAIAAQTTTRRARTERGWLAIHTAPPRNARIAPPGEIR